MDCVGCDKCRLWGKLQTRGLGTALKILFTSEDKQCKLKMDKNTHCLNLQLKRTEIVSLFNAFGRYVLVSKFFFFTSSKYLPLMFLFFIYPILDYREVLVK